MNAPLLNISIWEEKHFFEIFETLSYSANYKSCRKYWIELNIIFAVGQLRYITNISRISIMIKALADQSCEWAHVYCSISKNYSFKQIFTSLSFYCFRCFTVFLNKLFSSKLSPIYRVKVNAAIIYNAWWKERIHSKIRFLFDVWNPRTRSLAYSFGYFLQLKCCI